MSSLFLLDVYALETQTFVCGNQIWHFSAKKLGNSSEEFTFYFLPLNDLALQFLTKSVKALPILKIKSFLQSFFRHFTLYIAVSNKSNLV